MKHLFFLLFGAVSLVAHAQVPDYVPTEGLVAWYPFNGNANDESGNGYHGLVDGALLTADRFNQSNSAFYVPPGANVNFGEDPSFAVTAQNTISIGYWFYAEGGKQPFLAKYLNSESWDSNFYVGPQFNGDQIVVTADGSNSFSWPIADGWNHTLVIYYGEQSEAELWCNGVSVFSGQLTYNDDTSSQPFLLHSFTYSGEHPNPDGIADDIGFWNRALSEEEILALYNAEPPAPGCTDPTACNFDAEATSDDGSCIPSGCMDSEACNYNALAECAGEACDYTCCPGPGCCGPGTVWDTELQYCVQDATCIHDLDFDGVVGVNDLMELLSAFGTNCPEPEEPATAEWTCGDPVSYHGYDYATVQIGEQCWFAENLRTEQYANGDAIPANLSDVEWSSTTSGAVAVYGEDAGCESYSPEGDACDPAWSLNEFGRLYNWYAVDDARGLCPTGWHVPTDEEWMTMEMELGMSESAANSIGWRGTDQGAQIKTTYGWNDGGNGTNSSGFSGLPGGYRHTYGGFLEAGSDVVWWSSSPSGSNAWYRDLDINNPLVSRNHDFNRRSGFSVRCLKDAE